MATIIAKSEGKQIGSYTLYVSLVHHNGMEVWQAEAFEGWDMAEPVLVTTSMSEHGAKNTMQVAMLKLYKTRQSKQEFKEDPDYTLNYKDV